ncbi:MAG TPA: hypothetical protein VMT54_05935 [Candidatus Cybelea sp.]|nr:hypothetical protein [Candidatus Cybelea sp.]
MALKMREPTVMAQTGLKACLAILFVGSLVAGTNPASAEGDAKVGGWLARYWCSSCHALGTGYASDAAPPLETIAKAPNLQEGWLRAWLANPHPPMPNFSLSRTEIDDIIAYLQRLRAQ